MESKRKSNGADGEDRASKRQRTAVGETEASTTKVGLAFLEQIRRTGDKSGRRIATYFEELLPKESNKEYYRVVRMPISLSMIERKLHNDEFANLSELESFVKRMVQNAKDFYPRSSHTYDDAERIRKATSNFMVKHNPAYKIIHGYSAVPTPIPDDLLEDTPEGTPEGDTEADSNNAGEDVEGAAYENAGKGNVEEDEAEEETYEDDNDGAAGDEEELNPPQQNSPLDPRDTSLRTRRKSTVERAVSSSAKPDHEYAGVPYKGLTFQQAQEKILEEVIRRPDDDEDGYAYFEPFFNLPSRALKDYFQLIKDPLSLKKLQKLVKGIKSRTDRSGVTEYKTWAAFEEKASLLWENAYFYNEDGSPIAKMAKELEAMFRGELKSAKEAVPEPPQPKIKIKVPPGQETPIPGSKKITIHVANANTSAKTTANTTTNATSRGASADSSEAPKTADSPKATPKAAHVALEKTRSLSVASCSPSAAAATAHEDSVTLEQQRAGSVSSTALQVPSGASPAPPAPAVTASASNTSVGQATSALPSKDATVSMTAATAATPAPPPRPAYESKFRETGFKPLMTNLSIRTHPTINTGDKSFELKLPPHPRLTQRSVTLNIPPGQWRQQMTVNFTEALQQQQRPYKFFVIANGATLGQGTQLPTPPAEEIDGKLFDVNLHPGVNVIQVQVIAGLPRGQKLPNGAEAELEKLTIFANLLRN